MNRKQELRKAKTRQLRNKYFQFRKRVKMTTPQYRSYGADTQRGDRTDLTAIVTATPQVIATLHLAKYTSILSFHSI